MRTTILLSRDSKTLLAAATIAVLAGYYFYTARRIKQVACANSRSAEADATSTTSPAEEKTQAFLRGKNIISTAGFHRVSSEDTFVVIDNKSQASMTTAHQHPQ